MRGVKKDYVYTYMTKGAHKIIVIIRYDKIWRMRENVSLISILARITIPLAAFRFVILYTDSP